MAIIGVLVTAVVFAAMLAIGSVMGARQLAAEIAKIRAAGEPVTAEDLEAFYARPPKERDATELWLGALAVLDSPAYQSDAKNLPGVGEGGAIPRPGEPWPQLDAAETFLAKYREPLEQMHEASDLGGAARYPTKFSDGIAMRLPHVQALRSAVRLLELETEIRARRNDAHGAAEAVRATLAAARSLEQEPLAVSQLVRIAMDGVACAEIERLMPAIEFSEDDLIAFDRDLRAPDYEAGFRRSLVAERALGTFTFANLSTTGIDDLERLKWSPLRNADQAAYLILMEKLVLASRPGQLPLRDGISQADEEVATVLRSSSARWRYPVAKVITPSFAPFAGAACRAQARQGTTRSGIAIERYRRIHGELPRSLDQLAPDFLAEPPKDPFDGAPLRYRIDATGCIVYSVGPDGLDQDGASGAEGQPLDIAFEVKAFEVKSKTREISP
jgi:hypothetical protein